MADRGRVSCGRDFHCVPDLAAALNVASKGGLVILSTIELIAKLKYLPLPVDENF